MIFPDWLKDNSGDEWKIHQKNRQEGFKFYKKFSYREYKLWEFSLWEWKYQRLRNCQAQLRKPCETLSCSPEISWHTTMCPSYFSFSFHFLYKFYIRAPFRENFRFWRNIFFCFCIFLSKPPTPLQSEYLGFRGVPLGPKVSIIDWSMLIASFFLVKTLPKSELDDQIEYGEQLDSKPEVARQDHNFRSFTKNLAQNSFIKNQLKPSRSFFELWLEIARLDKETARLNAIKDEQDKKQDAEAGELSMLIFFTYFHRIIFVLSFFVNSKWGLTAVSVCKLKKYIPYRHSPL